MSCPNNYLANQARLEAERFGIDICIFKDTKIPREFIEGKAILITTAHKFFNGMTVFGADARYTEIGTIILDDSHACIDAVNNAFSITLRENTEAYKEMLSLFTPDLKRQGEGSFLDLCNKDYDTLMQIPYWSWMDKSSEVLEILVNYKDIDEIEVLKTYKFFKIGTENKEYLELKEDKLEEILKNLEKSLTYFINS